MEEGEKTKYSKENIEKIILIIIIIILIFLITFYIVIYKMGKIGQEVSNIPIKTIEITQNNMNWNEIKDLEIFSNPEFSNEKIIIPKSKGSYEFVISNKLNERVKYNINLKEKNELNVNMKYRLKLNNIYVIRNKDTWVDIEELNLNEVISEKNSSNIYTLEWYWEEDTNDTQIGKQVYAEYKCSIEVISEIYT